MGWIVRRWVGVALLLGGVSSAFGAPLITAVEVEARRRSAESLAAIVRLSVGDDYSAEAADAALKRLYATGAFDDVRLSVEEEAGGVRLLFHCVDRTFLSTVRFTDHRFSNQALREAVGLAAGQPLDPDALAAAPERLRAFYRGEGYPRVRVAAEVEKEIAARTTAVTFQIDPGPPLRLTAAHFTGPPAVARWRLWWTLGLHLGDHLRPTAFPDYADRLTRALRRRGYLEARVGPITVAAEEEDHWGGLVVPVAPGVHTRVEVKGNHAWSRREVVEALDLARHPALDEAGRKQMAAAVENGYRQAGYDDARVEVDEVRAGRSEGEQRLTVRVHEGRRLKVAAIHIDTGGVVEAKTLRSVMALARERTFGRPVWFRRDLFEADRGAIEAQLRLLGYYEAHLTRYTNERTEGGVVIDVAVTPGGVAQVVEVEVSGAHAVDVPTLLTGWVTPAPLRLQEVRALRRRMVDAYRSRGYLDAEVKSQLVPLGERRWRLELTVEEGVQARVGATHVVGLERTAERVVRRELRYHEGEPLDPARLHETRQALARLGLYEQVEVAPDPLLAGDPVRDVVVEVDEGKQGTMAWSLGFGSAEQLRTTLEVSHLNPLGYNRPVAFLTRLSGLEHTVSLSGREPRLFDSHTGLLLNVVQTSRQFENFTKTTVGTAAVLERELLPHLHGSAGFQYDNSSLSNVTGDVRVTDADLGHIGLASAIASLLREGRDNPLDPTRGWVVGSDLQWSTDLLLSERNFLKLGGQAATYLTPRPGWTTALGVRLGSIVTTRGGEVEPIQVRYFLGGASTLRAFRQDELAGDTADQLGGSSFLLVNAEERFPIYHLLRGVVFTDIGNVFPGRDPFEFAGSLRRTAGLGLRLRTPAGPLRIDYAIKLNRRGEERRGEINFSLGQAF
ncbi:MAG: BamA/TamA family outer membrane protein [Deltaproteobacteria bacterium]|nr:BamA/TamA family outer membrane protein [Deltaproteobacteria bacterium]NCS73275.1 BamA/TamA family outer membrane protein [Deltaproteobacteria bacterium]